MTDRHSLRHDLDGAAPEEQAIHLALQREVEVDLTGYATQKWVRAQGYLTSVPESPSTPGEPIDINLDGYATEDFVKTHVGDTALVLSKNIQTVTMNLAEEAKSRRTGDQEVEDASVVRDELLSNKIEDEVKGNTAAHLVLNEDIRNLSDVKYNKSGGNLTGPVTIRTPYGGGTRQLIVEAKDLGEQKQAFSVCGDGAVKAGYDASHPFLASAKNDVVTKAYLDQAIAAIPEPEIPEPTLRLPGLTWNYKEYGATRSTEDGVSEQATAAVTQGQFTWNSENSTFYISCNSACGILLGNQQSSFNAYTIPAVMTIYDQETGLVAFIKVSSVQLQSYGGQNYFRIVRSGYAKQALNAGKSYNITLSGVF